ncbi:MAG TPA: hypothetical protein VMI10_19770 [Terriglobales bacterium]|nr:hypothetical protein [Terriglobales bacterium]
MVVESSADLAANAGRISPRRVKKNAMTVVAKDFKEPFDPQVHNPPVTIFHDGKVRVLAPGQAGAIERNEHRNRNASSAALV